MIQEYEIVDIDWWENDATLVVEGQRFYFQFGEDAVARRKLTLLDALQNIDNERNEFHKKAYPQYY